MARSVGPDGVGGRRPLESNRRRKKTPAAASSRATCQQLRSRERLRQDTTSRHKSSTFRSEDGNASKPHSSIRPSARSGAAGGRALHHCSGGGGRRARVAPVRERPSVGREYRRWTRHSSSATQVHESTRGRYVACGTGRKTLTAVRQLVSRATAAATNTRPCAVGFASSKFKPNSVQIPCIYIHTSTITEVRLWRHDMRSSMSLASASASVSRDLRFSNMVLQPTD